MPGTIAPIPADALSAGSLAGYSFTCPTCCMVLSNTMRSSLDQDVWEHMAWHDESDAAAGI